MNYSIFQTEEFYNYEKELQTILNERRVE